MNGTISISMDNLWGAIQTLSPRNKRWLANKLNDELNATISKSKEDVLAGFARGVKEAKSGSTLSEEEFWAQLS